MRKQQSLKNFITGIIPYFVLAILGFVRIDFFIDALGEEIYALNQLFLQLFSYISLVEAGIGALITQQYYKHLAMDDHDAINGIYTTSKRKLKKISILVMIIGIIVSFFLKFLTNNHLSLWYMQIVFVLFLFRSVLEYLMLSPRFVLQADQKMYKINLQINAYKVLEIIAEIILLLCGVNYIIILLSSIIIRFITFYRSNKKIFKEYPWLHTVEEKDAIALTNTHSVFWHKIADSVYNNTDILLISARLSPLMVTIYSSYNYIVKFITDGVNILSNAITASFGNVIYINDEKDRVSIFEEINIFFFACAMFFTIVIYIVANPFVALWIGSNRLMGNVAFMFMMFLLFHAIVKRPLIICRDANGLFKETQVITMIEAFLNLGLSIILLIYFGMVGVLAATVISTFLTSFWFYPNYIYKKVFQMNPKKYYIKYIACMSLTVGLCLLGRYIINQITISNYWLWIVIAAIVSISAIVIIFIFCYLFFGSFRRMFKKVLDVCKNMFLKKKKEQVI